MKEQFGIHVAMAAINVFTVFASTLTAFEPVRSLSANKFVNPIGEGADPWVIRDPQSDRYLWCSSFGNRAISVQSSPSLTSLGQKHIVWTAPDAGPVSQQIWAPELHFLDDHWHIYFAASDGDNANHLAYVLKSKTKDPLGEYELHGPFATGDGSDGRSTNIWAIDMTVLELDGRRYAIWSGWDAPGTDQQFLYIAPMKSTTELAAPRVRLCANDDHRWERVEPDGTGRGLNEGPQIFQANGKTCIIYSCAASWLPTYKLGLLELIGDNPTDPSSWKKHSAPAFHSTDAVYGVGHSCFVQSPDRTQWWHIFHAKRDRAPGWQRAIFVEPMKVDERGFPNLGRPHPVGQEFDRPSGETTNAATLPIALFATTIGQATTDATWNYYGHHQFVDQTEAGLQLGTPPVAPVNDYRCGEKIVLNQLNSANIYAEVIMDFHGNTASRDAGILFHCSAPSVGHDAQRAYFAGLIPRTNLVILGRTDGTKWTEIARAATKIDTSQPNKLAVKTVNNRIQITHNDQQRISVEDDTWRSGSAGLRVVDSSVRFTDFKIRGVEN